MPEGKGYEGGFGPGGSFPMQNGEGQAVASSQMTKTGVAPDMLEAHTDASLNAKKTNPFGPCWPGLAEYFSGRM
jgi:hypothetical protein